MAKVRFENDYYDGKKDSETKKQIREILRSLSFYILSFFSIILVVPIVSICAITFMITGTALVFILPIKLIIDFLPGDIFKLDLYPYLAVHPYLKILLAMIVGALLFILGRYLWKLTIKIVYAISHYDSNK